MKGEEEGMLFEHIQCGCDLGVCITRCVWYISGCICLSVCFAILPSLTLHSVCKDSKVKSPISNDSSKKNCFEVSSHQ